MVAREAPVGSRGNSHLTKGFNLDLLSEREKEILDLAIDGLTDQQIGNHLGITASTVNSYWVRIRGKLGHMSRTELVSKIVSQRAANDRKAQTTRIRALEDQVDELLTLGLNSRLGNLMRSFLDTIPLALVMFDANLRVIFCNKHFEEMFILKPGSANTQHFSDLFSVRGLVSDLSLEGLHEGAHFGLDHPLLGKRTDGSNFRAFIVVGKGRFDGGEIYSCIVRRFGEEAILPLVAPSAGVEVS